MQSLTTCYSKWYFQSVSSNRTVCCSYQLQSNTPLTVSSPLHWARHSHTPARFISWSAVTLFHRSHPCTLAPCHSNVRQCRRRAWYTRNPKNLMNVNGQLHSLVTLQLGELDNWVCAQWWYDKYPLLLGTKSTSLKFGSPMWTAMKWASRFTLNGLSGPHKNKGGKQHDQNLPRCIT